MLREKHIVLTWFRWVAPCLVAVLAAALLTPTGAEAQVFVGGLYGVAKGPAKEAVDGYEETSFGHSPTVGISVGYRCGCGGVPAVSDKYKGHSVTPPATGWGHRGERLWLWRCAGGVR